MGKEGWRDEELFFQSLRWADGSLSNQEPRKKNHFEPSSGPQIDVNCELTDPVQGFEECFLALAKHVRPDPA